MAKRKEIKFKNNRGSYEGRQDGVIYRIHADRTLLGTCAPAYAVSTYDTKGKGRGINTSGHFRLHLDDAKEFCQKIANGEISPEELRQRFEAEDAAKEQAAIRAATAAAKEFRTKLESAGISYNKLLELEAERESLCLCETAALHAPFPPLYRSSLGPEPSRMPGAALKSRPPSS